MKREDRNLVLVTLVMFLLFMFLIVGCAKDTETVYEVYQPILSPTVRPVPKASFNYVGCFTDSSARALPAFLIMSGATVESCIAIATEEGYKYAGVQYGTQCFAGDTLGYTQVPDSECNMYCDSDSLEICGGTWLNSIYQIN